MIPPHTFPNLVPLPKCSSESNYSFRDKGLLAEHAHSHFSLFKTPSPTVKLGPISPTYSSTFKNKLCSGVDLSRNMFSTIKELDLNVSNIEAAYSISPVEPKESQVGMFATSHWEMGKDHPERDLQFTKFFFKWLSTTSSADLKRFPFFV